MIKRAIRDVQVRHIRQEVVADKDADEHEVVDGSLQLKLEGQLKQHTTHEETQQVQVSELPRSISKTAEGWPSPVVPRNRWQRHVRDRQSNSQLPSLALTLAVLKQTRLVLFH